MGYRNHVSASFLAMKHKRFKRLLRVDTAVSNSIVVGKNWWHLGVPDIPAESFRYNYFM